MMNEPYEGGSTVDIQSDDYTEPKDDRTISVNIPPVGYVFQRHEDKDDYEKLVYYGVWKRSDQESEQYWDRTAFLDQWDFDYNERRRKEIRHQQREPDFVDSELEDFREEMWKYRINGLWFYNNGYPVYLTGLYAFYLIWWKLDNGYPKFRVPDWEFFCFWQYCIDDPNCMGMVEATRRRQGKTMRSGVTLYEYASSHREAHSGIQSKSGSDAKDNVYAKGVLNKLKHLPDFFIPKYDLEKGKYPKSGLYFTETNVRGKASIEDLTEEIDELNSSVTWKASDHISYDGMKLHRYVGDEIGKTEPPIDVYKRHLVVYYCLLDDELNVIGKALYTTTVEEMKKGGAQFRLIWDASNQASRDENGMTNSGLYRYFQPSHRTLNIDKYGVPDEEKSLKQIMNGRRKLEEDGDHIALASTIRKTPINVKEMFYVDPDECAFDAIRLNHRLEQITWIDLKELYQIGNLQWVDGPGSSVKFIPNPKGKWWFNKDLDLSDEKEWNLVRKEGSLFFPEARRMAGVDPFSHNRTKDKKNSDGACYVGNKPDATNKDQSMKPLVEYIARPKTAPLFYEDMIMTWHFCGCEATVEDNKIGLINYAEDRGYLSFIKEFDNKRGITATTATHAHIMAELEEFVSGPDDDLAKCDFTRLLTDLFSFDISDTEKNDASMAFAYYRIGCFGYKYKKKPSEVVNLSDKLIEVTELFQ